MSEWITDRRPENEDSDDQFKVIATVGKAVKVVDVDSVDEGMAWMPLPEPYKPPEPDTSLAARKVGEWEAYANRLKNRIEVLREQVAKLEASSPTDDPDGVGEGWRLLRDGERIWEDDECLYGGVWRKTREAGCLHNEKLAPKRRRRIDFDDIDESEHGKRYEEVE